MKEQEQSQGESPKGTEVEPGSSQTMPAVWEAGLPLYSPSEPDTKPQVSIAEVLGGSETLMSSCSWSWQLKRPCLYRRLTW